MDLYIILEIEKWVSKEEIKKAYRKLAMKYHPDRNDWDKESEKKFKEINEAYSILSDENKRQQYDTFWTTWWMWWWNQYWWGFGGWVDVDLWDIFESFFGWGFWNWWWRKRQTTFKWEDLEYNINIDLETSIFGWIEKISFNKKENCNSCDWKWWKDKKTCSKCNWKWQIIYTTQSMFGTIQQSKTCDECNWNWEIFEEKCPKCNWEKRRIIKKEIEIDIPAGIDNGMIIKMTSEWNHWVWTKTHWDLYINFRVKLEEKGLRRDWTDLFYEIDIDVLEAILGTTKELKIPIIWKRNIEIKAWTNPWTTIKITWDWIKNINNDKKWDLYISLLIKIPKKLWKKEKELYEEVAKEKKLNVNKSWVFEKIFG